MITVAAMGRFHFFEQARALASHGRLRRIYCDDPRVLGALGWAGAGRAHWLAAEGCSARFGGASLAWRGARLARAAGRPPLLKINSAFALEALRARPGAAIWVDHGSLDERFVARRMRCEAEIWGEPLMAAGGNHGSTEVLDREAEEFARARGVVVASRLARESLIGEGVDPARIRVVPLGVDAARFTPRPRPRDGKFRVLHAGPVTFNKGVHRLLAAFAAAGLPDAELWIVGQGRPEVVEWLAARGHGLAVHFLPPVAQRELPDLFGRCDLFVLASLADGFGLTVLQAMACGLPAIVTDHCGVADVLAGSPSAEAVPSSSIEALAMALIKWHGQWREGARDLAAAARHWASRWTWAEHARRLAECIGGDVGQQEPLVDVHAAGDAAI